MKMLPRKGFTIVEFVVIVVIVALIGFVGFRFWTAAHTNQAATTPTATTDVASVKSTADLDTVSNQLDNIDVTGSFDKDLDAAASF